MLINEEQFNSSFKELAENNRVALPKGLQGQFFFIGYAFARGCVHEYFKKFGTCGDLKELITCIGEKYHEKYDGEEVVFVDLENCFVNGVTFVQKAIAVLQNPECGIDLHKEIQC